MIGDIDFLVKEEDFLKTAELLMNVGYSNQELKDGTNILGSHHHYPGLTKIGEPACVEIHRIPVPLKYSRNFTSDTIFRQQKSIPGKENIFVPSDNHKVILNFIHCQLSDSNHRQWFTPLRDSYDIYLLSKKVNLSDVLNSAEEKFKAQAYCYMVTRTFNLQAHENTLFNLKVQSYIQRYDWWLDHPRLYSLYFRFIEIYQLIFVAYLGKIINSVYSKSHRKYIWIRIKNPQWYKAHFLLIKNKFS